MEKSGFAEYARRTGAGAGAGAGGVGQRRMGKTEGGRVGGYDRLAAGAGRCDRDERDSVRDRRDRRASKNRMINRSVRARTSARCAVSAGLERGIQQCRKIKSLRCGASRHSSWRLSIFEGSERNENKRDGEIARDRGQAGRRGAPRKAEGGKREAAPPARLAVSHEESLYVAVKLKQITLRIIARVKMPFEIKRSKTYSSPPPSPLRSDSLPSYVITHYVLAVPARLHRRRDRGRDGTSRRNAFAVYVRSSRLTFHSGQIIEIRRNAST